MKINKLIIFFAFSILSLLACNIYGQNVPATDTTQSGNPEEVKNQQAIDKEKLNDAKVAKTETKSDAKVAQQINRDAMNASTEAKKAYRSEKKAQKSRNNANKQAKKAVDAREKSDKN